MNTGVSTEETQEAKSGATALQANQTEPLGECVRKALHFYLLNLDGHEVTDLHEMVIAEVERPMLEIVLAHTLGNQTRAARLLGMSRSTLRKKIAHYGAQRA